MIKVSAYQKSVPVIKASFVVLHDRNRLIDGKRTKWIFATRQDAVDFWCAKTRQTIGSARYERCLFDGRKSVAQFINEQIEDQINDIR